jgi:hypothetical protein
VLTRLDHLVILVRNLDRATCDYERLGFAPGRQGARRLATSGPLAVDLASSETTRISALARNLSHGARVRIVGQGGEAQALRADAR